MSLALFSQADLRYRVVSGAAVFFLAAVLLSAPADPDRVGLVVLAVLAFRPDHPGAVFSIHLGGIVDGSRRAARIVGETDLLVLGGIPCLFDWPGTVLALAGVEVWRW